MADDRAHRGTGRRLRLREQVGGGAGVHDAALEGATNDLRFIRQTLATAGSFTAISGSGLMLVGATALAAALLSKHLFLGAGWMEVWMAEAALAVGILVWAAARKARRLGVPLVSAVARKFVLAMLPPLLAGAALTAALWFSGHRHLVPGAWLLLYGTAVVTGGSFSVRAVPLMGYAFMLLGCVALALPLGWAWLLLAAGFGGLHLLFGGWIASKHGG